MNTVWAGGADGRTGGAVVAAGPTVEIQYASIAGGTLFKPAALDAFASPAAFGGVGGREMTLDVDESTGLTLDPKDIHGYTRPLLDVEGNAYTLQVGDRVFWYLLTDLAPTANVHPALLLHENSSGPLDANKGAGGALHFDSSNWEVGAWRNPSALGWSQRLPSGAAQATTYGFQGRLSQEAGSQMTISVNPRTLAAGVITVTNSGTIDDNAPVAGADHLTLGVMLTGAFTGTVKLVGAVYLVSDDGAIQSL